MKYIKKHSNLVSIVFLMVAFMIFSGCNMGNEGEYEGTARNELTVTESPKITDEPSVTPTEKPQMTVTPSMSQMPSATPSTTPSATPQNTVAPTEKAEPEPTSELVPTITGGVNSVLENGEIIFRYNEDRDVFIRNENNLDAYLDYADLVSYIDVIQDDKITFREEEKNLNVYHAGAVFVPKEISVGELTEIMNYLSQVAYLRYQLDYPETNTEYVIFVGSAEADFSMMNYAEYDYYEYKKLTAVSAWKDETFSKQTHQSEFVVLIDVCFYDELR